MVVKNGFLYGLTGLSMEKGSPWSNDELMMSWGSPLSGLWYHLISSHASKFSKEGSMEFVALLTDMICIQA